MISTVVDEGVDVLRIDRPEKRNALTVCMWRALAATVEHLDGRRTDAPIVVRGAGGYFSSGADLAALATARTTGAAASELTDAVVGALVALHSARRRTVALVDGGAAGGGVEIMLACDVRVATGPVTLVFPFGGHGVSLDAFTAWRLRTLVGDDLAARLVDGVHRVDAETAHTAGLVDAVVSGPREAVTFAAGRVPLPRWPGLAAGRATAARLAAAPMLASLDPDTTM